MRCRLRQILVAFLVAGVSGPVLADGLEDLTAGLSEAAKGRREEALRLLTQAIEAGGLSSAHRAIALARRAVVHLRGAAYRDAIADYDAAIGLVPDPITHRDRGSAYLEWDRFEEAAEDFMRAMAMQPANASFALWLHVVRRKEGTDDRDELAANLAKVDRQTWPGPLLAFLAGRASEAEVEQAAQSADPAARMARRCDMAFFLGEHRLAEGDMESLRLLREARDVCPADSAERALARADLLRGAR